MTDYDNAQQFERYCVTVLLHYLICQRNTTERYSIKAKLVKHTNDNFHIISFI